MPTKKNNYKYLVPPWMQTVSPIQILLNFAGMLQSADKLEKMRIDLGQLSLRILHSLNRAFRQYSTWRYDSGVKYVQRVHWIVSEKCRKLSFVQSVVFLVYLFFINLLFYIIFIYFSISIRITYMDTFSIR